MAASFGCSLGASFVASGLAASGFAASFASSFFSSGFGAPSGKALLASPEMRAAFLLRDAFDYGFDEIAQVVGRSPATCRQLVSRARKRLAGAEPPQAPSLEAARPIIAAFWEASRQGDMQRLLDLFAEDIEVHTDGGGKVPAAINVLSGRRRAAGLFAGLARKNLLPVAPCPPLRRINGAPGFLSVDAAGVLQTTAVSIRDGRIAALWIVRNPEKLRHLPREHA